MSIEDRCLQILNVYGRMRQPAIMRCFIGGRRTKKEISVALSSLVKKQLINRDGLFFYSVKEEQNEPFNAG